MKFTLNVKTTKVAPKKLVQKKVVVEENEEKTATEKARDIFGTDDS